QLAELKSLERDDLNPRDAQFVERSRRSVRRSRLVRYALIVGFPFLAGSIYGAVRAYAAYELDGRIAAHLADARAALEPARALTAEADHVRRQAFALFDARERPRAEDLWARALPLSRRAERGYREAGQALEAALAADSGRDELRRLFSRVLYERALLAERDRLPVLEELVQRLPLYDDGTELRRWNEPATIVVESVPPGAVVQLQRYAEDERRKLQVAQ